MSSSKPSGTRRTSSTQRPPAAAGRQANVAACPVDMWSASRPALLAPSVWAITSTPISTLNALARTAVGSSGPTTTLAGESTA